jgi:hypothetical protein
MDLEASRNLVRYCSVTYIAKKGKMLQPLDYTKQKQVQAATANEIFL